MPEGFGRFEAIRAVIDYAVNPWTEPCLVEKPDPHGVDGLDTREAHEWRDARAIVRGSVADIGYALRPTDNSAQFWQELRRLSFAFSDNDWLAVRGFYRLYGPLGDVHETGVESWAWAAAATEWFRGLTVLVDAIENGRLGQLVDFKGVCPNWRGDPWNLHPPHGLILALPTLNDDVTDEERYLTAWVTVIEAVTAELGNIPLAPIYADLRHVKTPTVAWGFSPAGAFQAGFLQWYFKKLAHIDLPVCNASDCTNLVPPGRAKWCSDRCRERVKKQRRAERRGRVGKRTGPRRARTPREPPMATASDPGNDEGNI